MICRRYKDLKGLIYGGPLCFNLPASVSKPLNYRALLLHSDHRSNVPVTNKTSQNSIDSNHLHPISPSFNTHTLTNTDPLPTNPTTLEGRLNHHASQLQKLATRIETVNEWLALDIIVLRRLEKEIDEERPDTPTTATPQEKGVQNLHPGSELRIAVPTMPVLGNDAGTPRPPLLKVNTKRASSYTLPSSHEKTVQTLIAAATTPSVNETNNSLFEIRTRISSMQRWRRELERAVVWQREECWRVEKALGRRREPDENVQGRKHGEEGAERRGRYVVRND